MLAGLVLIQGAEARGAGQTDQRDGRRGQDVAAHFVHHLDVARQAHVRDEGVERAALHAGQDLPGAGHDRRDKAPIAILRVLVAQGAQVVDVLLVHGQLMRGHVLGRVFRVSPARLCPVVGPQDIVGLRAGQVRREGHVERQIDVCPGRDGGRRLLGPCGALHLRRSCDGHFVVGAA